MTRLPWQAPGCVRIVGVEPAPVRAVVSCRRRWSALPRALADARRVLADMGKGKDVPAGADRIGPAFCQG